MIAHSAGMDWAEDDGGPSGEILLPFGAHQREFMESDSSVWLTQAILSWTASSHPKSRNLQNSQVTYIT